MVGLLDLYDVAVSAVAAMGLIYLLYSGRYAVPYRRFYRLITVGLLVSAVGGALLVTADPAIRHAVHAVSLLLVAGGLYDLVRTEIRRPADWESILLRE